MAASDARRRNAVPVRSARPLTKKQTLRRDWILLALAKDSCEFAISIAEHTTAATSPPPPGTSVGSSRVPARSYSEKGYSERGPRGFLQLLPRPPPPARPRPPPGHMVRYTGTLPYAVRNRVKSIKTTYIVCACDQALYNATRCWFLVTSTNVPSTMTRSAWLRLRTDYRDTDYRSHTAHQPHRTDTVTPNESCCRPCTTPSSADQ